VPPQHNPYAQPSPYAPQAQPAGAPYYPPGAAGGAYPGTPQPGGGGAGKAVLWAVVGAVVASALWGAGVLVLHKDSGTAAGSLSGYTVTGNLCAATDTSPFTTTYPKADTSPGHSTIKGKAVDDMSCSESLEMHGSSYADAYLYVQYGLHKKTDPGPEFTDNWLGYTQQSNSTYQVKPISGYGDEAYLVTEDTVTTGSTGTQSGDRYVTLAVRDGWMTYSMNWSQYASSLSTDTGKTLPTLDEAIAWVKTATTATLGKLRG
jgi:hypothetical protein